MRRNSLILFALIVFAGNVNAAFTENSRRYLHPRDIFNVMAQKFPVLTDRVKLKSYGVDLGCWAITAENENVIGVVNPAIGKAAAELPPPGFVRWIGSCAHKVIAAQVNELFAQPRNEKLFARYFPADILKKYRDPVDKTQPYDKLLLTQWGKLDPKEQHSLLKFSVTEMIGPEPVIHDLGYAKNMNEVTEAISKTLEDGLLLKDALHNILLSTMMREEFQTY
ncbi:MAG: hypothetical protein ACXVA9_07000 [Bdellovibrionales bacterium]